MLSTILTNLYNFALSMPTNMIILFIICLIMKVLLKRTIGDCVRVIVGYLLIGLLLGIFGISMPNLLTVGNWIVTNGKAFWEKIW
ncbi:MAG: hypothetical protein VZS44_11015 [Bacilli bacterium]|nr:hypothetical protein [Bacilli bacterium]